jgi:hypothetical protein
MSAETLDGGSFEEWFASLPSSPDQFERDEARIAPWVAKYGEEGDVRGRFCRSCGTHFCPHAALWMYERRRT